MIPARHPPEPALESASPVLLRRRAKATFVDLIIAYFVVESVLFVVILGIAPKAIQSLGGFSIGLSLILLAPIHIIYCFVFELLYTRTPGKLRYGVQVTDTGGNRPDAVSIGIRNLLRYVDWLPAGYLLGWGVARRSETGQRLGDRLAGTIVVRPLAGVDSNT